MENPLLGVLDSLGLVLQQVEQAGNNQAGEIKVCNLNHKFSYASHKNILSQKINKGIPESLT